MCILDLGRVLMYEFHHDKINNKNGNKEDYYSLNQDYYSLNRRCLLRF